MTMRIGKGILLSVAGLALVFSLSLAVADDKQAEIQQKLNALKNAHGAGILTDEEYAKKKAELEAQLRPAAPQLSEETKKKIDALTAARDAGILTEEEFQRKKTALLGAGVAPAPTPTPAITFAPTLTPAAPARKGKVHQHPLGFPFWYPDTWSVKAADQALQLTPPDVQMKDGAPMEIYFVAHEDASQHNVARPDDPKIIEYLDGELRKLAPTLQKAGEPKPIAVGDGKGTILDWQATAPTGEVICARAFVCLQKNNMVALVAIAFPDRLKLRDADLRDIFGSFGTGKPPAGAAAPAAAPGPGPVFTFPVTTDKKEEGAAATIGADELGDVAWGWKFKPPEGWMGKVVEGKVLLGSNTIAGLVIVMPHNDAGEEKVRAQMTQGTKEEGVDLKLAGKLESLGTNALVGDYTGTLQDQQVKARGVGTFSPHGGGAYILAVTLPDKYTPELAAAAESIGKSMQFFKAGGGDDLVKRLCGVWANMTGAKIYLGPDGVYINSWESCYSGQFKGAWTGEDLGAWGVAAQGKMAGKWTVRGDARKGVITVTHPDGTQGTIEYRVQEEKGQTYWNEYWFNNKLYGRAK